MQVTLDAAALRVGGGHDTRPRGPQLVVPAVQLNARARQRGTDQPGQGRPAAERDGQT